jgi:flagellar hook-length control protein FliK
MAANAAASASVASVATPGTRAAPQVTTDGLADSAARGTETGTLTRTVPAASESAPVSAASAWPGIQAPATAGTAGARSDSVATPAHVAAPVDSSGFAPAMATQVRWFVQSGVQEARMTLNPAEMGPLAVSIRLDGTQARIDFTADVAATRGAIESSLPALAAALADSGLTLAGGGVFDGSARQHGDGARRGEQGAAPGRGTRERLGHLADAQRPIGGLPPTARGLVDLVA